MKQNVDIEKLIVVLKRLASDPSRKKAKARVLKELLPSITQSREAGVPHSEIHKVICESGLDISFGTYQVTLHRLMKKGPIKKAVVVQKPSLKKPDVNEKFDWNAEKSKEVKW